MCEQVTRYTCDRCKIEVAISQVVSYSVHVGYQASVVGQEDVTEDLDLCPKCAGKALQIICAEAENFTEAMALVRMAKNIV
jgi:hypothetical protein